MADIYVGPTSAGSANGTSWANRYGSLNSAEDKPVSAGDRVICGPGVYREQLTVDVSGSSGNPIVYVADTSGALTDGVGGPVRITGSDNDQTATRATCVTATSKDYRTFRGFAFDTTSGISVSLITACSNWIVEDCHFNAPASANCVSLAGTGTGNTVRRCVFLGGSQPHIVISHSGTVSTSGHLVENCVMVGSGQGIGVRIDRVGGVAIKHCLVLGCAQGVRVVTALAAGQTTTLNNSIIAGCATGLQAVTAPGTNEEITENYNNLFGNNAARSNVSTGANSQAYPILFAPPVLLAGYRYPWNPFDLSQWSALRRIAGTSMSSDGLFSITRPATDSKKSWGPIQYNDLDRETTTKRTGAASLKLADAGVHQMWVPVSNVSTTFSCYVQWEADYAGTKPSMTVKQPGQSDTVVTATGSSGSWEQLTTTLTPAASPGYVIVEFRSSNTATSGSYAMFVDDFVVS